MKNIKDIAKKHRISNRELARRCGIPYRTVENWSVETNTPPEYVLNLIEARLNGFMLICDETATDEDKPLKMDCTALKEYLTAGHRISGGYMEGGQLYIITDKPVQAP